MPAYMPAQKRQDIREAIEAGMTVQDIIDLLHTSAGSVTKMKREMGLPIRPMKQTRTRGPVKAVVQVVPPAPTAPLPPEAYVGAFEARVLEYHALLKQKDDTHEQELRAKDATHEQLERECAKLRDEYAQTVFRQQNWQGPTSTIAQSLGNGG